MSFHISFKHGYNLTDNPQRLLASLNFRRPISLGRKVHLLLMDHLINFKKTQKQSKPQVHSSKNRTFWANGGQEDNSWEVISGLLTCTEDSNHSTQTGRRGRWHEMPWRSQDNQASGD